MQLGEQYSTVPRPQGSQAPRHSQSCIFCLYICVLVMYTDVFLNMILSLYYAFDGRPVEPLSFFWRRRHICT